MKESLSDLLLQLMYFRALTLDPKNMSERDADWLTKTYQALQTDIKKQENDDLSSLSEEALMEKLHANLNHDQKHN